MRIALLTGNHVCHNPRVIKEAAALAEAGFNVEVLGAWFDPVLKAQDIALVAQNKFKFVPVFDLAKGGANANVARFGSRIKTKVGRAAFRVTRMENRWQLGYAVSALRKAARQSKADMFIAHSEAALAVAHDLIKVGRHVGVDMEDWFSQDLLPEAREERPLRSLCRLESQVLRKATHSSCTSRAMSDALAREFDCHPPKVIYNAFQWAERSSLDGQVRDRRDRRIASVHWYSQTIGPGRGLEDLFAALPKLVSNVEVHLRGTPVSGFRDWFLSQVPPALRSQIFLHDVVPSDTLLSRIAEHDIGFAGEMKFCRSRDLTVTNKILQYLLAGLAVVASDTAGQREVAEQARGAVRLYQSGDPMALAGHLNSLLSKPDELDGAKAAALRAAQKTFCWEHQVPKLLNAIERALA